MPYVKSKMFSFDLSDKLKFKINKLVKKDKKTVEIINSKIKQIILTDPKLIDARYKNLRHNYSDRKRVHLQGSFVLTFRIDKRNKHIVFLDFDHHDEIYGK